MNPFNEKCRTLDRNFIFQAQTPQAFEYELILSAHKKFCDKDRVMQFSIGRMQEFIA